MADNEVYVAVENLTYQYPDGTVALRDVSLTIHHGEFIALIGQNGSGKTTLSKCLNGLFKPTKGRVVVDGLDTRHSSITNLATRVGYVFQNPDHQIFNNSVWKEIAYGPRNIQLPEEEVKARVEESARVVGLDPSLFDTHPFFLPKGIRQRVAIASILALRPKMIIVDEPTTGQDMKQSLEIMDFLKMLHEEKGHIIVIITHDMPIVGMYAKRTIVMAQGQILADGPTREVFSHPEVLEKTFVEPPQITRLAQMSTDLGFSKDVMSVPEMVDQFRRIVGG
ncbi:MAG TPA: energy-coupling factor transporter ATPase [Chloroflexi bacterium]|nr:energy-coupling factor transporter ATPase [Chloroflexota bacterium]